jgi:hypothetical protein
MELTLNLGWALVAAGMLFMWAQRTPRAARDRGAQLVALAIVIVILLPAISMTDDLIAARNPAEVDTCMRRDHDFSSPHTIVPTPVVLPAPTFAELSIAYLHLAAPSHLFSPFVDHLALAQIQNRPPPAA